MDNNPKRPNPAARLPQAHAVIGPTAHLQRFEEYMLPGKRKTTTTCTVVAMKDILYLYTPPQSVAPKPGSDKKKGNLRKKIKARADTLQSSQTGSSPSTSQIITRKRKAELSEPLRRKLMAKCNLPNTCTTRLTCFPNPTRVLCTPL